jgi:hypothetical protein
MQSSKGNRVAATWSVPHPTNTCHIHITKNKIHSTCNEEYI